MRKGNPFDVRRLDFCGTDREEFNTAFELAFSEGRARSTAARSWCITITGALIYFWKSMEDGEAPGMSRAFVESCGSLPIATSAEYCAELAWQWLQLQDYPLEPDTDGSVKKGFVISTQHHWPFISGDKPKHHSSFTPHPGGSFYGIVGVMPEWAIYGK